MHDDFLNHFPQEGGGQFFKSKVLSHNPHEFLGVDGGGLRLGKFLLQSGSPVFQFPLLLLIVRRQLHETLVADFAAYIVLIQPLDNAVHFGNACLGLFKLLRGCGGLSLAAACIKPPLLESQKQRLFLLGITEKYRKQDMSSFVISSQCNNCMAYQAKYKRKTATAK